MNSVTTHWKVVEQYFTVMLVVFNFTTDIFSTVMDSIESASFLFATSRLKVHMKTQLENQQHTLVYTRRVSQMAHNMFSRLK